LQKPWRFYFCEAVGLLNLVGLGYVYNSDTYTVIRPIIALWITLIVWDWYHRKDWFKKKNVIHRHGHEGCIVCGVWDQHSAGQPRYLKTRVCYSAWLRNMLITLKSIRCWPNAANRSATATVAGHLQNISCILDLGLGL